MFCQHCYLCIAKVSFVTLITPLLTLPVCEGSVTTARQLVELPSPKCLKMQACFLLSLTISLCLFRQHFPLLVVPAVVVRAQSASLSLPLTSIFSRPYKKVSQANYQALSVSLFPSPSLSACAAKVELLTFILGYCNWKCIPKDAQHTHTGTHTLHVLQANSSSSAWWLSNATTTTTATKTRTSRWNKTQAGRQAGSCPHICQMQLKRYIVSVPSPMPTYNHSGYSCIVHLYLYLSLCLCICLCVCVAFTALS